MLSPWQLLAEAFDDDEDLTTLARRYKTGPGVTDRVTDPKGLAKFGQPSRGSGQSGHTPFSAAAATGTGIPRTGQSTAGDDDVTSATRDAGLTVPTSKSQQHQQSVEYTKAWMIASRYADQVLSIDDRKDMAELVSTFAAGMQHKRPLSPQLMGRYVGKLLLAHTEEQARQVLMDLVKELNGEKR